MAVGVGLAVRYVSDRAVRDHDRRLVDWAQVEHLATRRLRAAPGSLTPQQLAATEASYARAMERIVPLLEQHLGTELPGVVERHDVVDRAGWARANLGTFKALVAHLEDHLVLPRNPNGLGAAMAVSANRFVTTRQLGFLLGFLGTRVLGQYDIALLSAEEAPGRLLFVEENIHAARRTRWACRWISSGPGSPSMRRRTRSSWRPTRGSTLPPGAAGAPAGAVPG